jgi:anti-sigma-K factor RskA
MDHNSEIRDCGADLAAYVLGALDADEAEAFRVHLESCVVCRDELAGFEHVVAMLPMGAPQHRAPEGLRKRVLETVADEPRPERASEPQARPRPLWAKLSIPRPALALGAAVAIAALAVAGVELGNSGPSKRRVFAAQVTGRGSAEITVARGHAELIVHHLSPPPAGQIYEVWLKRPGRPPAPTTALFSVTAQGDADVGVPGSLKDVRTVMVTPEPAGGSSTPTHPPVIRAQLS